MTSEILHSLLKRLEREVSPIETATVLRVRIPEKRGSILIDAMLQPEGTEVTLRLMMPYLGAGFGAVALPRIGDELIAMFPGRDRKGGYAFWSCYNGVDTVPPGTREDLILIEGRDGDDLRVHLRGGASIEIDLSLDTTVHEDEERTVDGQRTTKIGKDEAETVGGNRTLEVKGNEARTVAGNQVETIQGTATRTVTGVETETATTARITNVGGAWTINVTGAALINCLTGCAVTVGGQPAFDIAAAVPPARPVMTVPADMAISGNVVFTGTVTGDNP